MLEFEEYKSTFNCDVDKSTFKKIMGEPLDLFDDNIETLTIVSKDGQRKREFVPRKRGKWLPCTAPGDVGYPAYCLWKCSLCDDGVAYRTRYCQSCGADMREEAEQ